MKSPSFLQKMSRSLPQLSYFWGQVVEKMASFSFFGVQYAFDCPIYHLQLFLVEQSVFDLWWHVCYDTNVNTDKRYSAQCMPYRLKMLENGILFQLFQSPCIIIVLHYIPLLYLFHSHRSERDVWELLRLHVKFQLVFFSNSRDSLFPQDLMASISCRIMPLATSKSVMKIHLSHDRGRRLRSLGILRP